MNKLGKRYRRKARVRAKITGSASRPRLCLFRSNKYLYAQIIDDEKRSTILGISDRQPKLTIKGKTKHAFEFGKVVAQKALAKRISQIVFDRNGYAYHGRIKAFADGLRETGLKF